MAEIHPSAVIAKEAELADDVRVGPQVVIAGPVKVGAGVRIIAQAHLCGHTEIGPGCVIHPFVALGGPPQDYAFSGARSYCRIGARNTIREGVTIHCGTDPESATVVGDDCMLMANTHVAHNCVVGDHVVIINGTVLAGHVTVGRYAVLGGMTAFHQFVRVGEYAMIGGCSAIEQDAVPYLSYTGRCRCVGVNRIGLKRNGFTRQEINELRVLHRELFREAGILRKVAASLVEEVRTAPGRRLLEFILAESKRGIGGRGNGGG